MAGKTLPKGKGTVREAPYKSALEKDYAARLEQLRRADAIVWWAYEPWRFRLADGAWYKPDFLVMHGNGELEAIETKGYWRTADRLRIKVAASLHPIRFSAITRENGNWKKEEF